MRLRHRTVLHYCRHCDHWHARAYRRMWTSLAAAAEAARRERVLTAASADARRRNGRRRGRALLKQWRAEARASARRALSRRLAAARALRRALHKWRNTKVKGVPRRAVGLVEVRRQIASLIKINESWN